VALAVSMEGAKSAIRDGIRAAQEGQTTLTLAMTEASEATTLVRQSTHDSQHADVVAAIGKLTSAAHEAELSHRRFAASIDGARAYLAVIG
jgi:uncharacterized protein GlcG (DUF336 family)